MIRDEVAKKRGIAQKLFESTIQYHEELLERLIGGCEHRLTTRGAIQEERTRACRARGVDERL